MDKMFEAYLKDNRDISDKAVLVECAEAAGLQVGSNFNVFLALLGLLYRLSRLSRI